MSEHTWKKFTSDCPLCGGRSEVFTDCHEENMAYDGDTARCSDCHHPGTVVITEEGISCGNYIQWEDED